VVEDMEPRHLERLWNLDVWRGWAGPKATRELLWSMDWPGRAQSHVAEAVEPGFPNFGPAAGRSEQALECLHARDHGVGVIRFGEVGEIAGVHLGREGGLALYAGRLAGAAVEREPPP
jgi:hypothetical protein